MDIDGLAEKRRWSTFFRNEIVDMDIDSPATTADPDPPPRFLARTIGDSLAPPGDYPPSLQELKNLSLCHYQCPPKDFTPAQLIALDKYRKAIREYNRAINASGGFDSPPLPIRPPFYYGCPIFPECVSIFPLHNPVEDMEELIVVGGKAFKLYNEENGTSFIIVEFMKVNFSVVSGKILYMTIKAKPNGAPDEYPHTVFQVKAYSPIGHKFDDIEIEICRPLPSSN